MTKNKIILTLLMICLIFIFSSPVKVFGANCWVTKTWKCHADYYCSDWKCDNSDRGMFCTNWGRGPLFGSNATPPPPPPPPPVNGSCGASDGQGFFATPTNNFCSAGNATAISGVGPWSWTCLGYDGGGNSRTCIANLIPPTAVSCSVVPSCPDTANVKEDVTWSALVSGGTGTYTYAWIGDDFVNGKTTAVVTGKYTIPGTKNASVTVSDLSGNPVSVNCPTSCGGRSGGGSGGGIKITSNGVCEPSTNGQSLTSSPEFTNLSNLCFNGAMDSFLTIPALNAWTDVTRWTWICKGLNPNLGDTDASCSATLNPLDSISNLGCSLSIVPPNIIEVKINTNSTWSITPIANLVAWKVTDNNGTTYPSERSSTLNNIFTTTGFKTVSAKVSSSTLGVYGLPCSATTTVSQSGMIREQ